MENNQIWIVPNTNVFVFAVGIFICDILSRKIAAFRCLTKEKIFKTPLSFWSVVKSFAISGLWRKKCNLIKVFSVLSYFGDYLNLFIIMYWSVSIIYTFYSIFCAVCISVFCVKIIVLNTIEDMCREILLFRFFAQIIGCRGWSWHGWYLLLLGGQMPPPGEHVNMLPPGNLPP